jgi:hypothetical protein
VYKLAKWLYPKTPRLVRERKLRMLFFTIFLVILAAACFGGVLYMIYRATGK